MSRIQPDQVSCVIPYAGAQRYLREVVRSADQQGFREIVIVNDGCDPRQLVEVSVNPRVRRIDLPQSVGCPRARNIGIRACVSPYIVMLDHDDLLRDGYLEAMLAWVGEGNLRCGAATLRYIGEDARRVGAVVSRHADFFLPSGFLAEATLYAEAGYFPESCSDDLLFFRAIRKLTRLTTCPDAGVLYRIHPKAESSLNTHLWWAFTRLLPLYDEGKFTLEETNELAREFATSGVIRPGLEPYLSGVRSSEARFLGRSAYACWLNRDLGGVMKYGVKLLGRVPDLVRIARGKWR